jgi:hypothetical protein
MEAPRCIVCGQRHWSTQPCPAFADIANEEKRQQIAKAAVTKKVTEIPKPVTINPQPVTKKVTTNTPVTENVTLNTPVTINAPIPKLKRGRPKTDNPLSGAERTRRYRQRLRDAQR